MRLVTIRDTDIKCHNEHINAVVGRPLHSTHPYEGLPDIAPPDELKGRQGPMISANTDRCIGVREEEGPKHHCQILVWFHQQHHHVISERVCSIPS